MSRPCLLVLAFALVAAAQNSGGQKKNAHPQMSWKQCTKASGCSSQQGAISIDANWDWTHKLGTYTNCYEGNTWDKTLCPDATTCAKNCALDAGSVADYKSTYGISTNEDTLNLQFVTGNDVSNGINVGSRTYLYNEEKGIYQMFTLKNREFTFDVDTSQLPCGLNGALYFVQMDQDGGMSRFPGNKAGANFGTGYCDAQCPHDIKWISGEANFPWEPTPGAPDVGTGHYGSCCTEMDIWESNSRATAVTPHVCATDGQTRCEGLDCGDGVNRQNGVCDKDGCDWNDFRLGNTNFFGAGANYTVDSTKPMTVITQFITSDGTDNGDLTEIKRSYIQGGKTFTPPSATLGDHGQFDSVTDKYCSAQKAWTNNTDGFNKRGGLGKMGEQADKGMVLVMSLWDDGATFMNWLDSDTPTTADPSAPGVARGPCSTTSGDPKTVRANDGDATVIYSNIRYGEIGSTTGGSPSPSPPTPTPPTPTPPAPPSGNCPGGSISACFGLCPSNPPVAYKACVNDCVSRCS